MRQRKFLAMITATTMTLTTLLSPLTILALEDEITLEEESEEVLSESDGLEEVVTADENTTNSADPIEDNHTYTTDIGSIQIESSETELPAGLHAVITKTDESYAPYPGNESVSYSVRLLDKQSDEFIPEDGNGVYIIHLEIPTEFKDHELVLSQVKNIEESAESPAFEAIDFETNENGTELIIHSNALGGIFVLTDLSKKAAYESGVTQKDETNDVIQDSAPNYKSIFKSEDGDLRLKYGHSKMERVVYEVSKSDDYSSIMQKEGVKDFQTFNVRLLDKNGEDTKEQNEYMFRVFIPEEYQNYRVGIYRIYEPGEYTIHTKNERKHIISKTRFAVEIDSSINYINNTVHWDSDDLGIYILGIKESMDPVKKPATTKNEDGIICQTADGEEIRIENFDSNPPAGVFAQVIKEQEKPYSVSYSPRLYDSWNDMYNPAGPGLKYTMSFDLPEKFIGHNLELVMKEAKGFSGGSSSVYGSQHIPVEYELNQEGTRLTMHPVRLDRTFMLTDIELEAQAPEDNKGDANATDRPGDSSSTVTNKPSVTVNASTYLKLATQDSRYGSATAGPLKGDFKKDVFLLIEKASQNYEPHPGKKSSSIAIQLLDNDNHEYTFDEKDKEYYLEDKPLEYSVSLNTPAEFVGHELKVDMVEFNDNGTVPTYTPIEYSKKRGGRTLNFKPDSLNRIFVITDMDSRAETKNPGNNPFTDVKEAEWYFPYVIQANQAGLMTGLNATYFGPNDKMSRAMAATVLYRMAGEPVTTDTQVFPDAPSGQWYSKAVKWASDNKVITGYKTGYFGPDDYVTREQLATMIYRYQQNVSGKSTSEKASLDKFPDRKNVNAFAKDAVQYCVSKGIITGSHGYLLPVDNATRAECAKMLLAARDTK